MSQIAVTVLAALIVACVIGVLLAQRKPPPPRPQKARRSPWRSIT